MTNWQPIDTAPKDGTEILVYIFRDRDGRILKDYHVASFYDNDWRGSTGESCENRIYGEVSLWQPLPAPPNTD